MQKTLSNTFTGGMNWALLPQLVPPNQYEQALNAVTQDREGQLGGLSTEQSNFKCGTLPLDYVLIGHQLLSDTDKELYVLFYAGANGYGEIGIHNPTDCGYTKIVGSTCLNFNEQYPVSALLKIQDNSNRFVYFTDGVNPYRVINIDDKARYVTDPNLPTETLICDALLFAPNMETPYLKAIEVLDGGSLKMGHYQCYARYVDKELIVTNVIAQSNDVMINRYAASEGYFTIDGGYNISDAGIAAGTEQYPKTNKSIKYTLYNTDNRFDYVEFLIVLFTGGDNAISTVEKSAPIAISKTSSNPTDPNGTVTWVYTGYNGLSGYSINEVIIDKTILSTVKAHIQKDNRLFIANTVEETTMDYSLIQQAALSIPVRWRAERLPKFTANIEGNSKNMLEHKTYMRDEVYALGVQGRKKNGQRTPVFHIPGRAPLTGIGAPLSSGEIFTIRTNPTSGWDKKLLNIVSSTTIDATGNSVQTHEVEHLTKYIIGNQIERWRVYNTSNIDIVTPTEFGGIMAYYECDEVYPTIKTPNGLNLYGSLTGKSIRHHKMPDTNTILHCTDDEVRPLSLDIDLSLFVSSLPSVITNQVESWHIVQAERTDENKTVLDKGFTTYNEFNLYRDTPLAFYDSDKVISFYSPKSVFQRAGLNGTHYKIEWYNREQDVEANVSDYTYLQPNFVSMGGDNRKIVREFIQKLDTLGPLKYNPSNLAIKAFTYISPTTLSLTTDNFTLGSLGNITVTLRNRSFSNALLLFQMENGKVIKNPTDSAAFPNAKPFLTYGAIKQEKSVYGNLDLLTYFDTSRMLNSPNINTTINSNLHIIKSGDTFITPLHVHNIAFINYGSVQNNITEDFYYYIVESDLNAGMRHQWNVNQKTQGNLYHKGWYTWNGAPQRFGEDIEEYLVRMNGGIYAGFWSNSTADKRLFAPAYLYNKDYGYQAPIKPQYALSGQYDYIKFSEKNRHYYRIRYSEKSFQSARTDAYRDLRPNNYVDIDAQYGQINDLFVDKNNIYARTHKSILMVPTNVQQIEGNETSVYLGKAEVIPYEPKAVSNTTWYAGGYNFMHRVNTEFGTLLVDIYNHKIFLFRDGLEDITLSMQPFFDSFLRWDLLDFNVDYKYNRVITYYDAWRKRVLITMHRWVLNPNTLEKIKAGPISYNDSTKLFRFSYNVLGVPFEDLPIEDIATLEKYTISYDFSNKAWVSFHSYVPDYAFGLKQGFLTQHKYPDSTLNTNALWQHSDSKFNDKSYLMFQEQDYSFSIETTINGANEMSTYQKQLDTLIIDSAQSKQDSINTVRWDTLEAYTDKQHTGVINILPIVQDKTSMIRQNLYSTNFAELSEKEGYYHINKILDRIKVVNNSANFIWTFNNRLRKTLDTANIYTSQTMNAGRLSSKWIRVKLGLQYNKITDIGITNKVKQTIFSLGSDVDIVLR
jgi:hypothetical protein